VPLDGSSASSSEGIARKLESKVRMRDFIKTSVQGDLRRRQSLNCKKLGKMEDLGIKGRRIQL
jgi:hypothetical protein